MKSFRKGFYHTIKKLNIKRQVNIKQNKMKNSKLFYLLPILLFATILWASEFAYMEEENKAENKN